MADETVVIPLRRRKPAAHTVTIDIRCMSRIAPFPHFDYFPNKKNRFYMEMRCDRPRIQGSEFCEACQVKDPAYDYPSSRRFDHGKINEPIPDRSHIFGGSWYLEKVKQWGEPCSDVIAAALKCQQEARAGYKVQDCSTTTMSAEVSLPKKRGGRKKPTAAATTTTAATTAAANATALPLILQSDPIEEEKSLPIQEPLPAAKPPPKKRKPRAPKIETPPPPLPMVPETIAPTYKEQEMEEVDPTDYDVVRIRVVPFRDSLWLEETKKKVYRRNGTYVGRYDPARDEIDEDVPDSDNEEE